MFGMTSWGSVGQSVEWALRKNPERKNLESGKRDNPERNNLECKNPESDKI